MNNQLKLRCNHWRENLSGHKSTFKTFTGFFPPQKNFVVQFSIWTDFTMSAFDICNHVWACSSNTHHLNLLQIHLHVVETKFQKAIKQGAADMRNLVQWTTYSIRWDQLDQGPVSHSQHPVGQENFFCNARGLTQSSNTCHSQKIFHRWSWVSKQPRGLKQYCNSNDFIYSFNTKILPLSGVPGAYEVDQQCHKMFWQMTFPETMTHGLKATLWT